MINGKRLVVCVPYTHTGCFELLHNYLLREPAVDVVQVWCNSTAGVDMTRLAQITESSDIFRMMLHPSGRPDRGEEGLSEFFYYAQDKDSVYVYLEGTTIWFEYGSVSKLASYRTSDDAPTFSLGNVVNSASCAWLHQHMGLFEYPEPMQIGPSLDYAEESFSEEAALVQHIALTQNIINASTQVYHFNEWRLLKYPRTTMLVYSWTGKSMLDILETGEELSAEAFSIGYPLMNQRPNYIYGDGLFSNYMYTEQKDAVEGDRQLYRAYEQIVNIR